MGLPHDLRRQSKRCRPAGVEGDNLNTQVAAALLNLESVLGEAGAKLEDIVTWSILVIAGQPLGEAFTASSSCG